MILKKGYNDVTHLHEDGETDMDDSSHHTDTYEAIEHSLKRELFETIEVSTHFGTLTGTLVAVKEDYLVLVEATGSVVLVPFYNIEYISIA